MFSFLKKNKIGASGTKIMSAPITTFSADESLLTARADFPILSTSIQDTKPGSQIIYVDNACVSLRPQVVIDAITTYYTAYSSCAGRSNHERSRELDIALIEARAAVAKFIGTRHADEIIFTKNATESINLVAKTLTFAANDVVLTSHKEHNSNLIPWLQLEETMRDKRSKITHRVITPNTDGSFSIENLQREFDVANKNGERVRLVSVVHASNLDGTHIDIAAVVKCAHKNGALVLVDGCQAVGHIPVDVTSLGVDFYAFSAHKMCGPSGMGALFATRTAQKELSQFLVGGSTVSQSTYSSYVPAVGTSRFEAGLQDYAGILGFGAACTYLQGIGITKIQQHTHKLNTQLTTLLSHEIKTGQIQLLGPHDAAQRGSIFSFVVPGMAQTEFASLLDKTYHIAVRAGQHCVHSWFAAQKDKSIEGSVRVSLHFYNTPQEMEQVASAIKSLLSLNGIQANQTTPNIELNE